VLDNVLSPVHTGNNVEATFDFVEATFDFVAKNGNNVEHEISPCDKVETNLTCSICFDSVEKKSFDL